MAKITQKEFTIRAGGAIGRLFNDQDCLAAQKIASKQHLSANPRNRRSFNRSCTLCVICVICDPLTQNHGIPAPGSAPKIYLRNLSSAGKARSEERFTKHILCK